MAASPSSIACRPISLAVLGLLAFNGSAAAETDFVKAALAHGGFEAFVGLVSRAGLADTLGATPATVFMPTDAAFARLSAAQRTSIADLSPDGVRAFLGRFVFLGTAMTSNDVDKAITSENGTTFDVTCYQGRLSLRDHRDPAMSQLAFVVDGDIPAGPGMIDAVDAVLMSAASGGLAMPVAGVAAVPSAGSELEAPAKTQASGASMVPATPAPPPVPVPSTATVAASPAPVAVSPPPRSVTSSAAPAPTLPQAAQVSVSAVPAPLVVVAPPAATPATTVPTPLRISVAAAGLRGWPLKVSGNGSTGKVNSVIVGLPDGRVTGLTAHFGGFQGLGGRNLFVPWERVTPDAKAHMLRARMTAAEFSSAPATPPKP